jgi:hypothetical protein
VVVVEVEVERVDRGVVMELERRAKGQPPSRRVRPVIFPKTTYLSKQKQKKQENQKHEH